MNDQATIVLDPQTSARTLLDLPTVSFQVVESQNVVSEPYPKRGDVEPQLTRNQEGVTVLTVYNQGKYQSFSVPYIASHIILANEALVAVVIAFHGTEIYSKRVDHMAKGQFWRFYSCIDGAWSRIDWPKLPDKERQDILDACQKHHVDLPWMRLPGKLRSDREKSKQEPVVATRTAYKIVLVREGRYYSVYNPEVEYVIGQEMYQEALPHHRGGYFSCPSKEVTLDLFHRKRLLYSSRYDQQYALIECTIGGKIIYYENGKQASSYLLPVAVVELSQV